MPLESEQSGNVARFDLVHGLVEVVQALPALDLKPASLVRMSRMSLNACPPGPAFARSSMTASMKTALCLRAALTDSLLSLLMLTVAGVVPGTGGVQSRSRLSFGRATASSPCG